MFESIKNKIKNFEPLTKNSYGRLWNEKSGDNQLDWYTEMHNSCLPMHEDFIDFFKKNSFKTILEIGCGTGYYPINSHDLFKDKIYTGLDFSQTAIETCKRNSKFDFICTDFIKFNFEKKFDFIFSHAVIDHVYDIEKFIERIFNLSTKYAYITSYRGFFPELEKHKMNWNGSEGSYYNDISIKTIKKQLTSLGLKESEFNLRSIKVDDNGIDDDYQTIIEIIKESSNN